ncbi:MAG: biotin--[acetyl-CoA-carboxylase] ligase [Alphaproteobacteria bacterium]|nr:biotin--[acetyl-CoA-carboxylase] ligase [Alphaproteobacteria bacterium]
MKSWPAGTALLELDQVDSTNDEARRRAGRGEKGPLWIIARRQTAGRGRRGNIWVSPSGNLAATLLLRPDRPAADCAQLSFAAALAVSDMLSGFAPAAAITLKWPNDVLVDGRKIAGILLESEGGPGGRAAWLAIGIGVNLSDYPPDTEFPAIALASLGVLPPPPQDALLDLAAALAKWYETWRTEGFAPIREAWLARAWGLGRRIRVRLAREELSGLFQGIDETGALQLGLPGGVARTITAGEVFFG